MKSYLVVATTGTHGSQRQGSVTIGWQMVMEGDDGGRGKVWQEKASTVIWTPALGRKIVGADVDGSSAWQMKQQMEALLGAKPQDRGRAQ